MQEFRDFGLHNGVSEYLTVVGCGDKNGPNLGSGLNFRHASLPSRRLTLGISRGGGRRLHRLVSPFHQVSIGALTTRTSRRSVTPISKQPSAPFRRKRPV